MLTCEHEREKKRTCNARAIRIYKSPLAAGIEHKSPSPAKVGVRGDRIVDEDLVKQAWPIYSAYIKSNS